MSAEVIPIRRRQREPELPSDDARATYRLLEPPPPPDEPRLTPDEVRARIAALKAKLPQHAESEDT